MPDATLMQSNVNGVMTQTSSREGVLAIDPTIMNNVMKSVYRMFGVRGEEEKRRVYKKSRNAINTGIPKMIREDFP